MRIPYRRTRNRILTLGLPVLGWFFLVSCESDKPRVGERSRGLQTAELQAVDPWPDEPSVYIELHQQDLNGDGNSETNVCVATPWGPFRVWRGGKVWFVATNVQARVEIKRDRAANGGQYNPVKGGMNAFEVSAGTSRSITTRKWKTWPFDKWDASRHDVDLFCYDSTYTSAEGDHWRPAVSPQEAICPTCMFAAGGPQMEVDD